MKPRATISGFIDPARSLLHILSPFYPPSISSSPPNLFSSVTSFNYPSPVIFYSVCSVLSLFFFHLFCPPLTCQVPNCTSWPFHLNSFFSLSSFFSHPTLMSLSILPFSCYIPQVSVISFFGGGGFALLPPPSLSSNLCSVIFHSSNVFLLNWARMDFLFSSLLVWIELFSRTCSHIFSNVFLQFSSSISSCRPVFLTLRTH